MNENQQSLWQFMAEQSDKLFNQTLQHLGLTFISLFFAVLVGLPLGILIARKRKLSGSVLAFAGVLQTIPSIALLGFMIPLLGIGAKPAIVALLIYALLPIIRNTYTGIVGIDANVREAAKAMGMSAKQILFKVELPLAMPVILAGIRTATVINVGVATLASYIAAGGLGEFIFGGISLNNTNMILAGAIPAAVLAILLDALLALLQNLNIKKLKRVLIILPIVILILGGFYLLPKAYGSSLTAGFTPEFMGRQDGDLGLKSVYGLKIHTIVISDAVMYKAAFEKELDVISGYSTDGRLKAFDLIILKDDKGIFPPYYAAPIVRTSSLKKFPELEKTLNLLEGKINDSIMTDLNYKTDQLHQSPERVAKEFLESQKLYKSALNGKGETVRIGSKIFGEQYILAEMYKMLIQGNTNYQVATKTGLGGTKICFDALVNDQIDFYPEYTGTGLLVLLQPDADFARKIAHDKDETYNYVKDEFIKKFGIKWLTPIGFNNSYALMMRRKQSKELGVYSITDLKQYLDNNK
ncbi:ABC transporter permease/substrate-binding protein [Pedobacter sp. MC2016-05]|uniref:ABC transporter permease/substrate-binding protein n=1 Tax=Pedobacter sp. MC2016-05 TaxID=2994474 RepID=UPI0022459FAA|nr:ABC transporter permease/substrate-binding protein [Pedobacter sp. MC2016-05]MCX2476191.1 ABC transporter permease/substrate-binding protein [Pedobacter sp. MC2016-05]